MTASNGYDNAQRFPVPYPGDARAIIENSPSTQIANLPEQIQQLQAATAASPIRSLRRLLFVWLRIYVNESKRGKGTKVNLAIPLPIPLIGALFSRHLAWNQAARVATLAQDEADYAEIEALLESCMGLELIRVEEDKAERGKKTTVVIGLD